MDTTAKIAIVSSFNRIESTAKQIEERYDCEILIRRVTAQNAGTVVRQLLNSGVGAIVARGYLAMLIEAQFDIPVIRITHSFFDCYNAWKIAAELGKKVAFMPISPEHCRVLDKGREFFPEAKIIPVPLINNVPEATLAIQRAVEIGVDVVISGQILEQQITEYGLTFVENQVNDRSLKDALMSACRIAQLEKTHINALGAARKELELFESMFDTVPDGIICADAANTILAANKSACGIFEQNLPGAHLDRIGLGRKFVSAVRLQENVQGELITVNGKQFYASATHYSTKDQTGNTVEKQPWPGNVRQLSNTIERLIVFCDGDHITGELVDQEAEFQETNMFWKADEPQEPESEKELIRSVMHQVRGNRADAAKRLNISVSTLYRRIKHYQAQDPHYLKTAKYGILSDKHI